MPLGVPIGARPNKTDIIPKPMWVRNLLKHKKYINVVASNGTELLLRQTRSGCRRNAKPNIHHKKRHHRPHTGKRGWKRETIYVLKKDVKIPPRFDFERVANQTVQDKYAELFRRNLEEALDKS